ncbi:MAG: type III-A CRISPR-associated protein Csm2 [Coprothermobacterota bacterium]|nr:type III-A CRISPR-associated protein Csm2 [Coprothermobacterota bacterium]
MERQRIGSCDLPEPWERKRRLAWRNDAGYGGSSRGGGNRPGGGYGSSAPAISLRADYLRGGYFNEKGKIRPEIYMDDAKHVAEVLQSKGMKPAALRRFYSLVRSIKDTARTDFDAIQSRINKLRPYAHYQVERDIAPFDFERFIEKNVDLASRNSQSFEAFVEHFECVVAWSKIK